MDCKRELANGDALYVEERFAEALEVYSAVLDDAAAGLELAKAAARASAVMMQLGRNVEACELAERATAADPQFAWAWYRKGAAHFALKQFAEAAAAFDQAAAATPRENEAARFSSQASLARTRAASAQSDPADPARDKPKPAAVDPMTIPTNVPPANVDAMRADFAAEAAAAERPRDRTRYEWFQSSEALVVTVFAKGVDETKSEVEIRPQSVSIFLVRPDAQDYTMDLDLCDRIVVDQSKTRFSPYKVELTLRKAVPGVSWPSLQPETVDQAPPSAPKAKKNWDAIGMEDDEDDPAKQDVNDLFKKIYSSSDEETRRAMNKSFQESGGKVLSTNWGDVKNRKVEYKEGQP